jgi:mRNA interferase RelE/StbE
VSDRYSVEIESTARKCLNGVDPLHRARILRVLAALEHDPRPPGARQLAGSDGLWRVRVGDYRVIYSIEDRRLVVIVIRVGHRREVYRR